MRRAAAAAALVAALGGCDGDGDGGRALPPCEAPIAGSRVSMRLIGEVSGSAVLVTAPPADLRLFVVEQRGAIRIFTTEALLPTPFLDLSADAGGPVVAGGEQGLLGLAFHPRYADNRLFYVFYTTRTGGDGGLRDVLARCRASVANADVAEPACEELLSIPDFAGNHNGGMIEFGRDGFLYVGTGDGGGGGDPNQNGQSLEDGAPVAGSVALLGKILRLDVDRAEGGRAYGIPRGNPYAAGGGAPEIWIRGVRNPWRWSFDRETGDLWIADVGQGEFEEVTVLAPGAQAGANLGWRTWEARSCFDPPCSEDGFVFPQDARSHADGWVSITGGQVYRGTCYPDLVGSYFYTDYGRGGLSRARLQADLTLVAEDLPGDFPGGISSLHEDARGELFATTTGGDVYHLEAGP